MSTPEQGFTNLPNRFLDTLMPMMGAAAVKVTIALIRKSGRATRAEIQAMTGLSKQGVFNALDEMRRMHIIASEAEKMSATAAAALLKKKLGQTGIDGDLVCAWCKCRTLVLHAHHFPIAAKDGGTETVDICPNCHAEYHVMVDTLVYKLRPESEWIEPKVEE